MDKKALLEQFLNETEQENKRISDLNSVLNNQNKNLESEILKKEEVIKDLDLKIEKKKKSFNSEQADDLDKALDEIIKKKDELDLDRASIQSQFEVLEKKEIELEELETSLKNKASKLDKDISSFEQKKLTMIEGFGKRSIEIDELEKKYKAGLKEVELIRAELTKKIENQSKITSGLEKLVKENEEIKKSLINERQALHEALEEARESSSNCKEREKELDEYSKELKTRLEDALKAEKEAKKAKQELESLEGDLKSIRHENEMKDLDLRARQLRVNELIRKNQLEEKINDEKAKKTK